MDDIDVPTRREVKEAKSGAALGKAGEESLSDVSRRLDRLTLVCAALWEIVEERGEIPDNLLRDKIHSIDLRDGKLDGRYQPKKIDCTGCGRILTRANNRCIYCGRPVLEADPFDLR